MKLPDKNNGAPHGKNELLRQNAYLKILHEITLKLMQRLDIDEFLVTIINRAGEFVGTKDGFFCLYDETKNVFKVLVGIGGYKQTKEFRLKSGKGPPGEIFEKEQLMVIPDYIPWKDRNPESRFDEPKVVIGLPLKSENQVVGILGLGRFREDRVFTEGEINILSQLAELASFALTNERFDKQFREELKTRQTAEAALQKSERNYKKLYKESKRDKELYQSFLNSNAEAIVVYDLNGGAFYVSPAFTRLFGWTLDELKGKQIPFVPESEVKASNSIIKDLIENGTSFQDFKTKRYTKDGRSLEVCLSGACYHDEKGKPAGMVSAIRDISETKMMEAQFLQAQKMEALGTLVGGVAHDFNNLLGGILGNVGLLHKYIKPDQPAFKKLKVIEKIVLKGANLTKQLLGHARRDRYEPTSINLNVMVNDTVEMLVRTSDQIRAHTDFEETLWEITGDQTQIQQVLLNICINAADAMPSGGDLYLSTRNTVLSKILVKHYMIDPGKYVILTIRDTGHGMDRETRNRVFEPFFTTKDVDKGTGLGLASAYGIIKSHNGYIDVYSELNKGTIFNIYLPSAEQAVHFTTENQNNKVQIGTETILLVDDEYEMRDIGEAMLNEMGYDVVLAKDGEEAIGIYELRTKDIDLVILDMVMPGIGGRETYHKLREMDPDVKVLFSSGFSADDVISDLLDHGCNDFIQKPFSIQQLSELLRQLLN